MANAHADAHTHSAIIEHGNRAFIYFLLSSFVSFSFAYLFFLFFNHSCISTENSQARFTCVSYRYKQIIRRQKNRKRERERMKHSRNQRQKIRRRRQMCNKNETITKPQQRMLTMTPTKCVSHTETERKDET